MKKLRNFVKNAIIGLIIFWALMTLILALIAGNVKSDLLNYKLPIGEEVIDSIVVHFTHGSIPSRHCSYKKKRLGGFLGGHIEIQIDDNIYGFLFDSIPINYLPQESFNSKFEVRKKSEWKVYSKDDKITSIYIPVDSLQKNDLQLLFNRYLKSEPYDYAFLGQRCSSATAEILSDAKILNKFSNFESIVAFFYPRSLRNVMLKYAEKYSLKRTFKEGIECHRWE